VNSLFGKVNWSEDGRLRSEQNSRFCSGILDLTVERHNKLIYDNMSYLYNEKTGVLCSLLGYFNNIAEIRSKYSIDENTDVKIVEKLYSLTKLEFISELDGHFLVLIFNERTQNVYLFQSEYGFGLPVYYTRSEYEFMFSTSLKQLLKHSTLKRELNIAAVHDFLFCTNMLHRVSIVPNETTFIKNINKLVPGKFMEINGKDHSVNILPLIKKNERVPLSTAREKLVESIRENTGKLFEQLRTKDITVTLTGGWDSSTVLFFLRKLTDNMMNVITIHGGEGYNEIPTTTLFLENYRQIRHITGSVPANLGAFPDVTWKFEGYLFEEGMFLRYELSKLLAKEKIRKIFMGTLADQILRSVRRKTTSPIFKIRKSMEKYPSIIVLYRFIRRTVKRLIPGSIKIKRPSASDVALRANLPLSQSGVVYDVELDYVLKIHEIILNSFGVQGLYPFINKNTAMMSKALGTLNRKKRFYKEKVKEVLPSAITSLHPPKGPTTSARYLFDGDREVLMKVFESDFAGRILPDKWINRILKKPEDYYLVVLQLTYIFLFERLFISGEFDSEFDKRNLDIPLSDFF